MLSLTCASQKFILVSCLFSDAMYENLFLPPVRTILIILMLGFGATCFSQPAIDTTRRVDSLSNSDTAALDTSGIKHVLKTDSIKISLQYPFTSDSFLYRKRLFFSFTNPIRYTIAEKTWSGKEVVFYTVLCLLIVFALIRNSFRRYLADLFSSYFRTTVRQRQIKEQLLQSPLPSLLFNIFFIVSTAVFLSLLFQYFQLGSMYPFWMLTGYCAIALVLVYAGKFLALKFFGWVFQLTEVTETYIFVVFSTNKIIGVSLLPLTVLLAFTYGAVNAAAVTLSLVVIAGLFAYRYFLSYVSVNHMVRINFFHFLVYLAAFEILPLLLINKLLFSFLREIS